jgi:hypothetical protein
VTTTRSSQRRALGSLAVAVLLVLAGCSGFGGTPPPADAPAATPTQPSETTLTPTQATTHTATPTSATTHTVTETSTATPGATPTVNPPEPTPTATPGATATPRQSYPPGYGEGGVTDADAATAAHADALATGDGFVAGFNGTLLNASNEVYTVTWTQAVETDSREVYGRQIRDRATATSEYLVNDTLYVRYDPPDGDTHYDSREVRYDLRNFTGGGVVRTALVQVTYGDAEVLRENKTTFDRYDGISFEDPTALFGGDLNRDDVSDFEAVVVVDEGGVVRGLRYAATVRHDGDSSRLLVAFSVGGLEGTTVEEPRWVDEARNSS